MTIPSAWRHCEGEGGAAGGGKLVSVLTFYSLGIKVHHAIYN